MMGKKKVFSVEKFLKWWFGEKIGEVSEKVLAEVKGTFVKYQGLSIEEMKTKHGIDISPEMPYMVEVEDEIL